MVADPEWFLELTRQTHKRRFCGDRRHTQDVLKLDQETDADMVIGDDISRATMTVHESRSVENRGQKVPSLCRSEDKTESG